MTAERRESSSSTTGGKRGGRFSKSRYLTAYRFTLMARRLDQTMLSTLRQGKSFFHIGCAGHKAVQVGAAMAFRPGYDWFYLYYCDLAFNLTLGVTPEEILLNFLAKAEDPSSGGRQMPQHCGHAALRIVTQSSPTGTQYLQAVGAATAMKLKGKKAVALNFIGEGGPNIDDFHERLNFAAVQKAPFAPVVENNQFAYSAPMHLKYACENIADRAAGYGIPGHVVDGTDVAEVPGGEGGDGTSAPRGGDLTHRSKDDARGGAVRPRRCPIRAGARSSILGRKDAVQRMESRLRREVLREEMRRDESVILLGEDIGAYGGAFKATKGLVDEFGPERVIDTPISESAGMGSTVGMDLFGFRPVDEIQFADFITVAYNQVVRSAATIHYR